MILDYSRWTLILEETNDIRRFFSFDLTRVVDELTDSSKFYDIAAKLIIDKYPASQYDSNASTITIVSYDHLTVDEEPVKLNFSFFDIPSWNPLLYPKFLISWLTSNSKMVFSKSAKGFVCELYDPYSKYTEDEITTKIAETVDLPNSKEDLYAMLDEVLVKTQLITLFDEEEVANDLEEFMKALIHYIKVVNTRKNIIATPVTAITYNKETFVQQISAEIEESLVDFSSLSEQDVDFYVAKIAKLLDKIISISRMVQKSEPKLGRAYVKLLDHLDQYPEVLERILNAQKGAKNISF